MPKGDKNDQHDDYSWHTVSSVTSTATTAAESAPKPSKIIQNDRARRGLVFHLQFGGVPVVVRHSGENFLSPFN